VVGLKTHIEEVIAVQEHYDGGISVVVQIKQTV
jgi:hypothetical protein